MLVVSNYSNLDIIFCKKHKDNIINYLHVYTYIYICMYTYLQFYWSRSRLLLYHVYIQNSSFCSCILLIHIATCKVTLFITPFHFSSFCVFAHFQQKKKKIKQISKSCTPTLLPLFPLSSLPSYHKS